MNDVILRTTARMAIPVILMYALYLLARGHNEPGGGFIAGLVTVAALVLRRMAADAPRPGGQGTGKPVRMDYPALAGLGLLVAAGTGVAAVLFGRPFLTSAVVELDLSIFGHTELASAVLFDIGVFLVVIGAAMAIIEWIGQR